MKVEVVYVSRDRETLLELDVEEGVTAGELIVKSRIGEQFPNEDLTAARIGIWGTPVERGHRLRAGDRVEIYRPLVMDPREARMQRVKD